MNQLLKNLLNKMKNTRGNSLMEFAVTTGLMAILAATAAPKLSNLSEGAKASKTMSELDKLGSQAANFFQERATIEGRGRFPGQDRYNYAVGGHADVQAILDDIINVSNAAGEITDPADFDYYAAPDGSDWVSVFGVSNFDFPKPEGATLRWDDEDELADCNVCPDDPTIGRKEWEKLFPGGPVGSPYQDGHYVYQVVAGSGAGTRAVSPILYLADIENPSQFYVILQP
tara:strand:+ start:86 stop:772 length:687 start_codon:yes stop_codon:yes gene_type:complete